MRRLTKTDKAVDIVKTALLLPVLAINPILAVERIKHTVNYVKGDWVEEPTDTMLDYIHGDFWSPKNFT